MERVAHNLIGSQSWHSNQWGTAAVSRGLRCRPHHWDGEPAEEKASVVIALLTDQALRAIAADADPTDDEQEAEAGDDASEEENRISLKTEKNKL